MSYIRNMNFSTHEYFTSITTYMYNVCALVDDIASPYNVLHRYIFTLKFIAQRTSVPHTLY